MEQGIADNLQCLQHNCSDELCQLLNRLCNCQQNFLTLLQQAVSHEKNVIGLKIELAQLIGPESEWTSLQQKFQPGAIPDIHDFTVLWTVRVMSDKAGQFYHQAASQPNQPQFKLLLSTLAEIKRVLSHRIGAVERTVANQVWKAVGFAPGLLGKE
jgi:hypothetical protein